MNCIIIEDQPPAQRILKKFIEDVPFLNLTGVFTNALQALEFLNENEVNLIFLDIHLPKVSGMDFLKMLDTPPKVILTTAFSEYALESYEHNVIDYLLKPFSFQRFLKAVNRSRPTVKTSLNVEKLLPEDKKEKEIFIKSGYEYIRIKISNVIYIRSDADYTELITPEKKYLSSDSLKYWKERFEENNFIQIHKSYIINANKITKIAGNQVFLENGDKLPIGRSFKEEFSARVIKT